MGPKEISKRIETELGGDLTISNEHSCVLSRCLVRPKRRQMFGFGGEVKDYWVVLEEYPENHEGYKTIFDEENERFGLAQYWDDHDTVLGFHKDFLTAFKAM